MISDSEIAGWISKLYVGPAEFGHIVQVNSFAPYVGINMLETGEALVIPRGSITWQDWFRDLDSESARIIAGFEQFGKVPFGFGDFAVETYRAIAAFVPAGVSWIVGAHSLGCPEGVYQALIRLADGGKVSKVVLAAPPNPGTPKLAGLLASYQIPVRQYWNKGDLVPTLPVPAPEIELPWCPATSFRFVKMAPKPDDLDLLFRCHHMNLYLSGITEYEKAHAPS